MTNPVFFDLPIRKRGIMKFKDDARSRLHETSDRDCDNIPNVVSKIDHDKLQHHQQALSQRSPAVRFDY